MSPQIEQKSQEIAHAFIRIAAYIRKPEFKRRVDTASYDLIAAIASNNPANAMNAANVLKAFTILGRNTLLIEPMNVRVLMKELDWLMSQLRQISRDVSPPNLEEIFRSPAIEIDVRSTETIRQKKVSTDPAEELVGSIRQNKILEKIRQANQNKVQLKDLIAEFPGVSERTIRYDLKKLTDEGKIERQGSGGPSNYYVLKQGVMNL